MPAKDRTTPDAPDWSSLDVVSEYDPSLCTLFKVKKTGIFTCWAPASSKTAEKSSVPVFTIRKSAPSELVALLAESEDRIVLATRGRYMESELDFIIILLATIAGMPASRRQELLK
jgi:hypothetical protein